MQVVTLIYMAFTARKPVLALGFGSLLSIYSISTQGGKFHVLNGMLFYCRILSKADCYFIGPAGSRNPSKQLPKFDRYATEAGAYPSGWLDHGTGDIYCYKPDLKIWQPVCNVGIHRFPLKSPPFKPEGIAAAENASKLTAFVEFKTSLTFIAPTISTPTHPSIHTTQPAKKNKKPYSSAALDEKILSIRKPMLQHPFLRGIEIPLSQQQHSFAASPLTLLLRTYPHWYINSDCALPINEGIHVLAEAKEGPVVQSN